VLSGIGDVLILGRSTSGQDFDRATGMVPDHVRVDDRWRSLWNGATFTPCRIHLGTVTGVIGIGCLQWLGMRGVAQTLSPGLLRRVATVSATAFVVSGVLTHLSCGRVVLDYQKVSAGQVEPSLGPQPSPRSATKLLAASALGALGALAVFSCCLNAAAWRRRGEEPLWWTLVTPFSSVMSTLLTFGLLPAPVGGYLRPASMSLGLLLFFAVVVAAAPLLSETRT
jgi:hypothetical protein